MTKTIADPGELRTRLVLEAPTLTSDGMGGHAQGWAAVATVFARLEPLGAKSVFGADQRLEEATHRVTVRYRGDVAAGMRFSLGARRLAVMTLQDIDETGRWLVCQTREEPS